MTDVAPDLHERAAEVLTQVPLATALGLRLLDPSAPERGVAFVAPDLADNGAGGVHASALSAALETAGFLAVAPTLAADEHAVTHASAVQLVAPAPLGERIEVSAELDRRGRNVAFVHVVARVEGRTVARAQLTKSIVRRHP